MSFKEWLKRYTWGRFWFHIGIVSLFISLFSNSFSVVLFSLAWGFTSMGLSWYMYRRTLKQLGLTKETDWVVASKDRSDLSFVMLALVILFAACACGWVYFKFCSIFDQALIFKPPIC